MVEKQAHTEDEISAFVAELKTQTDRGAGIVAAAVIEDALEHAIQRRLVAVSNTRLDSLFGRMRPLSSFSAKIELGMALGLYDDALRGVLNMIRDVRNAFAHDVASTSFENAEITKLIQKIRTPDDLSTEPRRLSIREVFLALFYTTLALLNGMALSDIRIKPLSESHPNAFVSLALASQFLARRMEAERAAQADSSGRSRAKLPPG